MRGTQESDESGKRDGRGAELWAVFSKVAGKVTSDQRCEDGREPAPQILEARVPGRKDSQGQGLELRERLPCLRSGTEAEMGLSAASGA